METIKAKCNKCGWEAPIIHGRIIAIRCPKCGNRIVIKEKDIIKEPDKPITEEKSDLDGSEERKDIE